MTVQEAPKVNSPFRFLDLPGGKLTLLSARPTTNEQAEIRKRICKIAARDLNGDMIRLTEAPQDEDTVTFISSARTPNDWSKLRRTCLALTQVNRQIRAEFLPVYRQHRYPGIHISSLEAYIRRFIVSGNRRPEEATNRIRVITFSNRPVTTKARTLVCLDQIYLSLE